VLVYLITVMHSMHGGYMEKAERHTEKAIQNIMKLKEVAVFCACAHSRLYRVQLF
jgi:predicted translin family RNA/ssDNA-binding protein